MIELRQLNGGYRGKNIIHHISLTLSKGEITTIIGPNGAGKSTLLKTACGLLAPTGGQVLLDGKDLSAMPRNQLARRLSYLPQTRNVPRITVHSLVLHGRFPYIGYPRRYRREDQAIAQRAMDQTGVSHLAARPLSELSGGERQKVYLAMLLAQDTDALFLDEPTTHLDIACQLEIMGIVRHLNTLGKTVVMTLHDLNHALTFSDRIAVIEQGGTLRAAANPDEIFSLGVLDSVFGIQTAMHSNIDGKYYTFKPSPLCHLKVVKKQR
jgi:iron complex transport system ATP-binding protein